MNSIMNSFMNFIFNLIMNSTIYSINFFNITQFPLLINFIIDFLYSLLIQDFIHAYLM